MTDVQIKQTRSSQTWPLPFANLITYLFRRYSSFWFDLEEVAIEEVLQYTEQTWLHSLSHMPPFDAASYWPC